MGTGAPGTVDQTQSLRCSILASACANDGSVGTGGVWAVVISGPAGVGPQVWSPVTVAVLVGHGPPQHGRSLVTVGVGEQAGLTAGTLVVVDAYSEHSFSHR